MKLWNVKIINVLSLGASKGKWDMYLITPDQKILRSASDLKLYIAKSGAVIDSNIVNFSLPKKTAKVDKALHKKMDENSLKAEAVESPEEKSAVKVPKASSGPSVVAKKMSLVQKKAQSIKKKAMMKPTIKSKPPPIVRSSRRETKLPQKYREDDDLGDFSSKGRKSLSSEKRPLTQLEEEDMEEQEIEEEEVIDALKDATNTEQAKVEVEPKKEQAPAAPLYFARKMQNLSSIGVGTFSIDKETVRGIT